MNITKYQAFFHDGTLDHIQISKGDITLILVSAEVNPEEIKDKNLISQDDCMRGKLTIHNVQNIYVNRKKLDCASRETVPKENLDMDKEGCRFFQYQGKPDTDFQKFYERCKLKPTVTQKYDFGDIFELEITTNMVEIKISWWSEHSKVQVAPFEVIRIEGESVSWEPTFDVI